MLRAMAMIVSVLVVGTGLSACSHGSPAKGRGAIVDGDPIVRPSALYLVSMDTNADYSVDRSEFDAGVASAFAAADANRSGFLTPVELADWSEMLVGNRYAEPGFMGFDRNGDRKVTRKEFKLTLKAVFTRYDKNADGTVTRAEMVERLVRMKGRGSRSRSMFGNEQRRGPGRRR